MKETLASAPCAAERDPLERGSFSRLLYLQHQLGSAEGSRIKLEELGKSDTISLGALVPKETSLSSHFRPLRECSRLTLFLWLVWLPVFVYYSVTDSLTKQEISEEEGVGHESSKTITNYQWDSHP